MRVVMLLTAAGLAGGMAPGVLDAQVGGTLHLASHEVAAPVDGTMAVPAVDERELRRRMDSAERAMERGSDRTARKMYEAIADELLAAGVVPTEALWKVATLRYRAGEELGAAAALDHLAEAAAKYGDVVTEVRALLEAAHIYQLEGRASESVTRFDRAFGVLSTAGLPSETQVALLRRVRG